MNIPIQKTYSTPISNSSFLPFLLISLSMQKHSPRTTSIVKDEYDYIVVGGGAAGSVVTSRLSEKQCVTVLLLEAGPEPPLLSEVPAISKYLRGTDLDWKFKTVPQKHAASGFKNRQIPWSAGKMLGGSSSFNGMAYVRGNKKDYDYWAQLGARGWSYNDIFRYFLKLEDNRTPSFLANGYHAIGGPITVEQPNYQAELKQAASVAAVSMGYQFVDPNGKQQTGFYDLQANLRSNQRCSPVKGYLVPADKRTNLDISVNSFVTRVLFEDGRAAEIEFYNGMNKRWVKAKREIIITAGVVNTPKILMLSGVGPKEELHKFNIPVVVDLPVGKNFHDHCGTNYFFTLKPKIRSITEKMSDPESIKQYIRTRSGPLSSTDNVLIAFLNSLNRTPLDFPNYQVFLGETHDIMPKNYGLKSEIYEQLFKPYENTPKFQCNVQNLHTRSKGTVTLNSSNPFDPPLIDPNYLQDPRDLEDVVDGLKFCRKLLTTKPLLRLGAKEFQTLIPGCEMYVHNEEEYLRCYAKTFLYTFNHPVGTAKMGDASDLTTVVDPELRVKGVKGLRVADASVMPQVPSGNNQIPVIMIAEKASDMIKQSISCSRINKV